MTLAVSPASRKPEDAPSRLVMLDMTPSEALIIAAAIGRMRQRTQDQHELQALDSAILQLKLQLKVLLAANQTRKAEW